MFTKIASFAALWAIALTGLPGQNPTSPEGALRALKAGNQRFARDESRPQPIGEGLRRSLAGGQSPYAIVVTCADSRVAPEHVFNAGLGELFVIRTAGNVCDPETLASIEYAVEHLGTPLCVIMGHELCGAVAAAADGVQETPAFDALLNRISPSLRKLRAEGLEGRALLDRAEEENAQHSLAQALSRSALLRSAARSGRFKILAARYLLSSGEVDWLPERSLAALSPENQVERRGRAQLVRGLPPHIAMSMLRAGHRRFLSESGQRADLSADRRETLLQGQQPIAVVIACADSRVSPEHILDLGLGELFVIRVAGNVLNAEVLASVEYAVEHTGASLVLTLGHSGCGAVNAAIEHGHDEGLSPSMRSLLGKIEPAVRHARAQGYAGTALLERSVEYHAQRVADLLPQRSRVLRRDLDEGLISILAAVYELGTGDLRWLGKQHRSLADHHPDLGQGHDSGHEVELQHESSMPVPLTETEPPNSATAPPEASPDADKPENDGSLLRILFAATMISTGSVLFLIIRKRERLALVPEATEIEFED